MENSLSALDSPMYDEMYMSLGVTIFTSVVLAILASKILIALYYFTKRTLKCFFSIVFFPVSHIANYGTPGLVLATQHHAKKMFFTYLGLATTFYSKKSELVQASVYAKGERRCSETKTAEE